MTEWVPVDFPPPPDDFHTWAKPAPTPCPDCDCCSKALCDKAIADDSACHLLGNANDFDLTECPCWRKQPGHLPPNPRYPRGKPLR
ncbi:hypothetical protein EDD30_2603 [Couchioplanes caeruleus]|uniref:Uncharacterized protein n=2 Tax=Couchioplanes caeruleus TaxID=56438 RepID=A0A1K0FCC6_9ACTN|nr:hypothetical protein BG844_32215 [Couchioplanes caeruleus subsp. caeruleus]ROP29788.1 hypothetical protein EDD30_2603 [Couchioplanes caeruleus]